MDNDNAKCQDQNCAFYLQLGTFWHLAIFWVRQSGQKKQITLLRVIPTMTCQNGGLTLISLYIHQVRVDFKFHVSLISFSSLLPPLQPLFVPSSTATICAGLICSCSTALCIVKFTPGSEQFTSGASIPTVFLTYFLTFFLAHPLTCWHSSWHIFLTFFLAYLLKVFLVYLLAFYLTLFLTYLLTFFLTGYLSGLPPGILSDLSSDILSDTSSNILLSERVFLAYLLTFCFTLFLTYRWHSFCRSF